MAQLKCPICENPIDVSDKIKSGERITCHACFAQLAAFQIKRKIVLGCAMCKEPVFEPQNCGDCERRHEKKRILEEGRL